MYIYTFILKYVNLFILLLIYTLIFKFICVNILIYICIYVCKYINTYGGFKMAKIITIANNKGGVAKTTTTAAMLAGLSKRGFKVLGIDADSQGNLSSSLKIDYNNLQLPSLYQVLKREISAGEAVIHMSFCDIIPSTARLASAEQEITELGKEYRLKEALTSVQNNYDYIIIDTAPGIITVVTTNALTASNLVIIPSTAGIFSTQGFMQLSNAIEAVRTYCNNPELKISGILLTRHNPRTNISKYIAEITEQLGKNIGADIFNGFIRNASVVEESQAMKTSLFEYAPNSTVSKDYDSFIDEFLKREA